MILFVDSSGYQKAMATEYARQARDRADLLALFDAEPDVFLTKVAHDPVLWTNTFVMTLDPRRAQSLLPFVLWGYQQRLMETLTRCIGKGEDVLIEKSRDMGATWVILATLMWHWIYMADFTVIIGSRKEDEVDKRGDLSTHFERMRFVLRKFPEAYLERQLDWYDEKQHAGYMMLRNPVTGSQITGESTNSSFSRQGRYTCAFLDEFAVIDPNLQEEIWTATGDSTPCRIVCSTPFGAANKFARLAAAAR